MSPSKLSGPLRKSVWFIECIRQHLVIGFPKPSSTLCWETALQQSFLNFSLNSSPRTLVPLYACLRYEQRQSQLLYRGFFLRENACYPAGHCSRLRNSILGSAWSLRRKSYCLCVFFHRIITAECWMLATLQSVKALYIVVSSFKIVMNQSV